MSEGERVAMLLWEQKKNLGDPPWHILSTIRPERAEALVRTSIRRLEETDRMMALYDDYTTLTKNRNGESRG